MSKNRRTKNIAKATVSIYLFLLILFAGSCSATNELNSNNAIASANTNKNDKQISLFDGRVSFTPPDGFKSIQPEKLKRKGADNDSPKNIYTNESQSASIKIYFGDIDLEADQLTATKEFVEKTHQKFSKWITSEIIEMNGRQWFHFEWETPAKDTTLVELVAPEEDTSDGNTKSEVNEEKPIHYREYTTSLNKKNLRFVFETDAKQYPQIKDAFDKSIRTIQVKD